MLTLHCSHLSVRQPYFRTCLEPSSSLTTCGTHHCAEPSGDVNTWTSETRIHSERAAVWLLYLVEKKQVVVLTVLALADAALWSGHQPLQFPPQPAVARGGRGWALRHAWGGPQQHSQQPGPSPPDRHLRGTTGGGVGEWDALWGAWDSGCRTQRLLPRESGRSGDRSDRGQAHGLASVKDVLWCQRMEGSMVPTQRPTRCFIAPRCPAQGWHAPWPRSAVSGVALGGGVAG